MFNELEVHGARTTTRATTTGNNRKSYIGRTYYYGLFEATIPGHFNRHTMVC